MGLTSGLAEAKHFVSRGVNLRGKKPIPQRMHERERYEQRLPCEGVVTLTASGAFENLPCSQCHVTSPEINLHTSNISNTIPVAQAGAVLVARLVHILPKRILEVLR